MKQNLIPGKWYMFDPYNKEYKQKWYMLYKEREYLASKYFNHDGHFTSRGDYNFSNYHLPYVLADPKELNPLLAKNGLPLLPETLIYNIY